MISRMTAARVGEITDVHLRSFEGFFLSFLGPRFLRLCYENIVDYADAAGYAYIEDGQNIYSAGHLLK